MVDEHLQKEADEVRVVGPFPPTMVLGVHISQFGVISKSHQPSKWWWVVDLSYPRGKSVSIPKELSSMTYITIDDAISEVLSRGPGILLAKIDVRSCFRLVPVYPVVLAMKWKSGIFIDTCLPFGLRSSPKLFDILADFLAWILEHQGVLSLLYYLDDFLTIGRPCSNECYKNLHITIQVCHCSCLTRH